MVEWKPIPLTEDAARAFRITLTAHEEAPAKIVSGRRCSVAIEDGAFTIYGTLAPGPDGSADSGTFHILNDLQLTPLQDKTGLEGVAEPVYAIKPVGQGTLTLFVCWR